MNSRKLTWTFWSRECKNLKLKSPLETANVLLLLSVVSVVLMARSLLIALSLTSFALALSKRRNLV